MQTNDIRWQNKNANRKDVKNHVRRFLLHPPFWIDPSREILTNKRWKRVKFDISNAGDVPLKTGVYCFVVVPRIKNFIVTRYLFYIGKASSMKLRARYEDYIKEMQGEGKFKKKPRIKVEEMLNEYYSDLYFFFTEISDKREIVDCEDKLLNLFYPYVNIDIPEARVSEELKHIY